MLTRRRFLQSAALAGLGLTVPGPTPRGGSTATRRPANSPASPPLLDPSKQPRFVNPLPNPFAPEFAFAPESSADGIDRYDIAIRQVRQRLGLVDGAGKPLWTTVWGYGTDAQVPTYPGRTIHARRDCPVVVRWRNELVDADGPLPHLLPIDTTVHWALGEHGGEEPVGGGYTGPVPVVTHLHGGHNRADSDGLPDAWFTPGYEQTGRLFNEWYRYENDQEAATLWYHDHTLGITRLNVYAGLAGFYLLRDEVEEALIADHAIPSGPYEIGVAIQDRMFTADGELFYPSKPQEPGQPDPSVLPEFFGDVVLVNGQAWPRLDVEPRPYRIRLLNGSDSRFYVLHLSNGGTIRQIGTDGGLLRRPVELERLTLAPGERADVVVDFSADAGATIVLRNTGRSPFPAGDPPVSSVRQIMAFAVTVPLSSTPRALLPSVLRAPLESLVQTGPTRRLLLFETADDFGRLEPELGTLDDGALDWDDPITEHVRRGDTEIWELYNTTPDSHPIHPHEVSVQLVNRQRFRARVDEETGKLRDVRFEGRPRRPERNERGWKDTVRTPPGEVTRFIARFDLAGEYVWHCHILSHEDHEMMRRYEISA